MGGDAGRRSCVGLYGTVTRFFEVHPRTPRTPRTLYTYNSPTHPMPLTAGSRLGAYKIVGPLGAGGMGEVYRARDARLGRDVAIKVLPAGFAADPERLARFEQEARAAAALNHPNILAVHDLGQHAGAPFIVTELLEGSRCARR